MDKKNKEAVKNILLKLGAILADKGYVWDGKTKTAFNKAVSWCENH